MARLNNSKIKQKGGWGLVEALLGLAVVGLVMIAITSTTVKSMGMIKDNEIADLASSIALRSLEEALAADNTVENNKKYKIIPKNGTNTVPIENSTSLQFLAENSQINEITDCTNTSSYKIEVSAVYKVNMCIQIIANNEGSGIKIRSRVVYQLRERNVITELEGYKTN